MKARGMAFCELSAKAPKARKLNSAIDMGRLLRACSFISYGRSTVCIC